MLKFVVLLIIVFFSTFSFSQTGSSCSAPDSINSLPFIKTGLNTGDAANNYTGAIYNTLYMSGYDYVFRYKPVTDINIHVTVTNVNYAPSVFVVKNCPDSQNSVCLGRDTSDNTDLEILTVHLQADSTYYIIVSTRDFGGLTATTDFDIKVTESFQYDLAMYTYWVPQSSSLLNNDQQVHVEVINTGYDTIHNFFLNYSVNGGTVYTDYVDSTLIPGDRYYHYFTQHQDLSAIGEYKFKAYTQLTGDGDLGNDTVKYNVYHLDTIKTFPYYQDFETTNDWTTERTLIYEYMNVYSSWQLGTPNAQIINSAASGTKAWKTSLDSVYNQYETSFLLAPCFDFSNMTLPVFEADIWYDTFDYDYATFEYAIDSSAIVHFTAIGTINDGQNWYNTPSSSPFEGWNGHSGGWVHVKHEMPNLAGESKVLFRFKYYGGSTPTEGLAVDNISIHESPLKDLGVIKLVSPKTTCELGANESLKIQIYNYGFDTIYSFPVSYSINGGSFVTETVNQPIAFGDTLEYTFLNTVDLSSYGVYNIIIKTNLSGDQATSNDSILVKLINYQKISSFPYIQDFESSDGGFYADGINPSWEWGTPTDSVITNASSGTKCWVTNLSGYNNSPEESYLNTNCFDFTNLKNPKIKLDVWSETVSPSGGQIEVSEDSSISWQVVGQSATIDTNWYNQGYMWLGSTENWKTVYEKIPTYIGNPNLQFRIKFVGATQKSGLAIDNFIICDNPIAGFDYSYNSGLISFTDTSYNADSVKYIISDGTVFTSQNPIYNLTLDSVTINLIAYNFCGSDTTSLKIFKTNINQNNVDEVSIYPNPVNDFINIKTKKLNIDNYEIIDVYGCKVRDLKILNNNIININTKYLMQGVYFIKLYTKKGIIVKKFVKN